MRFWPFWIALEQNIHMGPLAHHSPFKTAASATETECASCIDLESSYFLIGSGKENQFWIWKRKHVTYIRRGARVAETWQVWWIVALTSGKNTAAPVNMILFHTVSDQAVLPASHEDGNQKGKVQTIQPITFMGFPLYSSKHLSFYLRQWESLKVKQEETNKQKMSLKHQCGFSGFVGILVTGIQQRNQFALLCSV